MLKLVVILEAALALLAAAAGAERLRELTLEDELTLLGGRPIVLHCHSTEEEWAAVQRENHIEPAVPPAYLWGFAYIGKPTIWISPESCRVLKYALVRGAAMANPFQLARAVSVLTHEVAHTRGVVRENEADACSFRDTPLTLRRLFGLRPTSALFRRIIRIAPIQRVAPPTTCTG